MQQVYLWILRLPFLGIIYAVVTGILDQPSELSRSDFAMAIGGISLCIGICIAAGLLKKPITTEERSKINKRMQLFFYTSNNGNSVRKKLIMIRIHLGVLLNLCFS